MLLDTPTIASKRWVYEQYDSTVQASTAARPGQRRRRHPGAGHQLRHRRDRGLQQPAASPSIPTRAARRPWPRRRATSPAPGRVPLGITDCLNFGNPEKPEVFFQFREACRGIADACRAFGTPVTGGNVSFYNESPTGAIDPTPTVGHGGCSSSRSTAASAASFATWATPSSSSGAPRASSAGRRSGPRSHRFVGGAPAPVDLQAERSCSTSLRPRPARSSSARPTIAARAGWPSPWRSARSAGLMPPSAIGATIDLAAYAPATSTAAAAVR